MIWILKSCSMDFKQLLKENSEHCFLSVGFDEFFILAGEIPLKSSDFRFFCSKSHKLFKLPKLSTQSCPPKVRTRKGGDSHGEMTEKHRHFILGGVIRKV